MHVAGRDAVHGLNDFPLFVFFGHGALKDFAVARFETPHTPGCAQHIEMAATFRCCRARGDQRSLLANRAVAIDAVDFNGGAGLAVNFSVAVIVLREMAVVALHPFFEMDVSEVYGFAETVWVIKCNLLPVFVEPVSFAIVMEDRSEDPAMAMEISKLRSLQLLVEFGTAGLFQKFFIAPEAAYRSALRIAHERFVALFFRGVALLRWIHLVAIHFVIPPGKAKIRRDHVRAGMNVADHALARRNRARENVLEGMAGFVLRNCGIGRSAEAGAPELRVGARVCGVAVVGIDHVTRGAPTGAIVAGMIVGARKRQDRVEQASFLQSEKNGICTQSVPKPAVAQLVVRLARIFFAMGIRDLGFLVAAAFEHAKNVAGL